MSLPRPREAIFGTVLWALAMSANAVLVLVGRQWALFGHIEALAAVYAGGGALGWLVGIFFARLLSWGSSHERRVAAALLCLAVATAAATGGIFALQYGDYYSTWHAPFLTVAWTFQFVFTTASALYQFAVLGLRLFLPIGLVALITASLFVARRR